VDLSALPSPITLSVALLTRELEDLNLVIIPATKTLDVNPASPNIATSIAK
jgi:hypothetical protein